MPNPIPVVLLGRLAVDSKFERQGLGTSMLKEAIQYAKKAASTIGVVTLATEAISETAQQFYLSNGFKEAIKGSRLLIFPLSDNSR